MAKYMQSFNMNIHDTYLSFASSEWNQNLSIVHKAMGFKLSNLNSEQNEYLRCLDLVR